LCEYQESAQQLVKMSRILCFTFVSTCILFYNLWINVTVQANKKSCKWKK